MDLYEIRPDWEVYVTTVQTDKEISRWKAHAGIGRHDLGSACNSSHKSTARLGFPATDQ